MAYLRGLSRQIPGGYEVRYIDEAVAPNLSGETVYTSHEEFMKHCMGFFALSGKEPVGSALSYANPRRGIEIQIFTDQEHQRKGLATATGAALVVYCLERGIEPHWNAANSVSARLAEKLGYVQNDFYQPLALRRE